MGACLEGCCVQRGGKTDLAPAFRALPVCQPRESQSSGQTQDDSTNRPYPPPPTPPPLLHTEFIDLALTWGGSRNITPGGEAVERADQDGKVLSWVLPPLYQQEQRLCHCGQEAANATRIIHDNYNQVRAGKKMGSMGMTSGRVPPSAFTALTLIHSPTSIYCRSPELCVPAKGVVVLPDLLISWAPYPHIPPLSSYALTYQI